MISTTLINAYTGMNKITFTKEKSRSGIYLQTILAIIILLLLYYTTEMVLIVFFSPSGKDIFEGIAMTDIARGFFFYFFSHLIVASIVILLFELPRHRIQFSWWHLFLLILICYPASIATKILSMVLAYGTDWPEMKEATLMSGLSNYPSILLIMLGYGLIVFWYNARDERDRLLKKEVLLREAKWQMLRYQVNPHFLFNSLNSIMALINRDKEAARSMVNELSNYFRQTLSMGDSTVAPIRNEVRSVLHYLAIQSVRFPDRLEYSVDISPELEDLVVPVFGIQTLVENAVKYGLKTATGAVKIDLRVYREVKFDIIRLKNTGHIWDHENDTFEENKVGTSSGLKNLKSRLDLMYPGMYDLSLEETEGEVHAIIRIEKDINPVI